MGTSAFSQNSQLKKCGRCRHSRIRPCRAALVLALEFGATAEKIVWWDGGLAGAANRFTLVPSRRAAVISSSNMSENSASAIAANRILDLILPAASEPPMLPEQKILHTQAATDSMTAWTCTSGFCVMRWTFNLKSRVERCTA